MAKVIYPESSTIRGDVGFLWNHNVGSIWREDLKVIDPSWKESVHGIPGGIIIKGLERTNEFHLWEASVTEDIYRLVWYRYLEKDFIWSRSDSHMAFWVHMKSQMDMNPYNKMDADVIIKVLK